MKDGLKLQFGTTPADYWENSHDDFGKSSATLKAAISKT